MGQKWGFLKTHILVGGFKHFLFSIIYGMSSFPLTNIFQRGWNHQPVYIWQQNSWRCFFYDRGMGRSWNMNGFLADKNSSKACPQGNDKPADFTKELPSIMSAMTWKTNMHRSLMMLGWLVNGVSWRVSWWHQWLGKCLLVFMMISANL
jgi:hypothetical protein